MVTEQQKQKMQHMLGFRNEKAPKMVWRNYWFGKNKDLEDLVTDKKAIRTITSVSNDVVYFLTPSGIDEIMGDGWSQKHKDELIKNEIVAKWALEDN